MRRISEVKTRSVWVLKDRKGKQKLAKSLKVSKTHIYRILKRIKISGLAALFDSKPGRKPARISDEERSLVRAFFNEYRMVACNLEKLIERQTGKHIPHNRIHKILKEENLVVPLSKKRKNYKWVRYEKEAANLQWHTDWCDVEYKGLKKHLIVFIDDYSRCIVSYGLFDEATVENTLFVLKDGIALHGKPKEIMSDKGVQFYIAAREGQEKGSNAFERFLRDNGIKQTTSRVKHPQSNGKVERFFLTFKQHIDAFADVHEFMHWYNNIRSHMSLDLLPPISRFAAKKRF